MTIRDIIQSLLRPRPRPMPAPVPPRPVPAPAPVPPSPAPTPGDVATALLAAHNRVRAARRRPPLAWDTPLEAAARKHATLMAARGRMEHQLPGEAGFADRITAEGYRWSRAAENVAAGQRGVPEVMAAWVNSSGHMANIVGPCVQMGGAMARGNDGTPYWSVSFASPAGPFSVEAARMLVTTVLGVGGRTSSIKVGPEESP